MTGETFDLFTAGMCLVQFFGGEFSVSGKTVAVQTNVVGHFALLVDLPFMAGILTINRVRSKLGMIDRHHALFDDIGRQFMARPAIGFDLVFGGALEEMAREANLCVHVEVLITFEVTVTGGAPDLYPVDHFVDVLFVRELNALESDLLRGEFFGVVTGGSQAGTVFYGGVGFCPDPSDETVDRLGHAVDLALDVVAESGL